MAGSTREAPPFDQGLFLLRLNKGREALRRGNAPDACVELSAALSMRPDDEDVLNLLSVSQFKAGDMEEAEKMTRRLLAGNPESAVLHSNLGVILVKNGGLDAAETELRRAIELKPNHSKSHLYLGFIYRQRRKLGLALEHFRYAGAEKLVTELQEQLHRATRDTGELRITEAAKNKSTSSTTNKIAIPTEVTVPAPAREATAEATPKFFTIRDQTTVEINFRGDVFVKKGTVASYGGKIAFAPEPKFAGTRAEGLLRASGRGTIFLAERGRRPRLIRLENQFFSVEGSRILAIGPSLSFRNEPIHDFPRRRRVDVLKIYGRGELVISAFRDALEIPVSADFPLNITSKDLIGWTGNLVPSVLPDRFLAEVMLPDTDDPPKIRFEGEGTVLTEPPA
jgi:hypothetical protein